jgi:hypothetical protein
VAYDVDGDGCLTFEEFTKMIRSLDTDRIVTKDTIMEMYMKLVSERDTIDKDHFARLANEYQLLSPFHKLQADTSDAQEDSEADSSLDTLRDMWVEERTTMSQKMEKLGSTSSPQAKRVIREYNTLLETFQVAIVSGDPVEAWRSFRVLARHVYRPRGWAQLKSLTKVAKLGANPFN